MPQLRKYSVKYPEKKNTKQRQQTNRKTELKVKKQQQQQQQKTITKTTNNTLAHNYKQVILSSIFYTEETIWLLLIWHLQERPTFFATLAS